MNLKFAVIVGVIGASVGTILNILPAFGANQITIFFYKNPISIAIKAMPSLCYLFFFIALLQDKKE